MMQPTTIQALGQARLADLHHQAQRASLARAVRQARPVREQSGRRTPGLLAALPGWACRPKPAATGRGMNQTCDRRGPDRKIPLMCHLRVTPSPCVHSYRPQTKETWPAGRAGMSALRPARAGHGSRRSLRRAQYAPPGLARSAVPAGRWLELE